MIEIEFKGLGYSTKERPSILDGLSGRIPKSSFVALLGENGAGKTTFLDLIMGFKAPTAGNLLVENQKPSVDPWRQRQHVAYLSEKIDMPADWSVREFLKFNRFFYTNYSENLERELLRDFEVDIQTRLGNLSAGELKRIQIVGGLAIQPRLIIADEITAVLDIIGRRKFLKWLSVFRQRSGCTAILATNILEDLEKHATHLVLLRKGRLICFQEIENFLRKGSSYTFLDLVATQLETP